MSSLFSHLLLMFAMHSRKMYMPPSLWPMDNLHYRFQAAKHDGRRLQAASERNGRRWSGHFVWRNTTADFELFIASIGMSFVTGNNKGAFRYIMGEI